MVICPEPGYTKQPYSHEIIGDWVFTPVLTRHVGGDFGRSLDERCVIPFNAKQGVSLFAFGGELVIVVSLLIFALLTRRQAAHATYSLEARGTCVDVGTPILHRRYIGGDCMADLETLGAKMCIA